MFAVLQNRAYALLWLSSLISTLGDWLLLVALPLAVLAFSGSALATGLTLLSATFPMVLFSPLAGVLVDRLDRRRLMVICDLSRAALLPGLLLVHDTQHLWIVYTVTFLMAMARQLFDPAARAVLPLLVQQTLLVRAGVLLSIAADAVRLIGPALGGLLYAASGVQLVVWLDVLSFLFSALLIAGMRMPPCDAARPVLREAEDWRLSWRQGWKLGWRRVKRSPTLRVLLLADALSSVKQGSYNVLNVVFVVEVLHAGAIGRGLISSAQALGGLLGGLLVGYLAARWRTRWPIGLGLIGNGACMLVLFALQSYPVTLALSALCGLPVMVAGVMLTVTIQKTAPASVLGRVFGIFGGVGGLALLLSEGAASVLGDHVSVVLLLSVGAGFELLAGVVVLTALKPQRTSRREAGGAISAGPGR
ncbi:MFS transporter [Deinococcus ruber]|uniref:MFS transporter n=1 Tax=Deinococcus ruber TaxID=1848197 RepID=A0A918KXP3_9DEIO|nr:MFS transporter [Deinococcus ruber]GGR41243.1 MFS transporter [Deinococcus ruber]